MKQICCAITALLVLFFSTIATATVSPAWVLTLMTKSEPLPPKWRPTFEASSVVIAGMSDELPVYAGVDGPSKTAALLVSLGWFESHFQPDATGDCDKTDPTTGMCVPGSIPHSFCMFQVNETNFAGLGVTRDEIMTDFKTCARSALRMIRQSFTVCAAKPHEDRLDHYAAGGAGCKTPLREKGRHRIRKGDWLFGAIPPP